VVISYRWGNISEAFNPEKTLCCIPDYPANERMRLNPALAANPPQLPLPCHGRDSFLAKFDIENIPMISGINVEEFVTSPRCSAVGVRVECDTRDNMGNPRSALEHCVVYVSPFAIF